MAKKILKILIFSSLAAYCFTPGQSLNISMQAGSYSSIVGTASWYADFSPGIKETTASMERFEHDRLSCAIWGLPFGAILRVTNMENNRSVYVRVNDRGPAKRLVNEGRIIDLTKASFEQIGEIERGLISVKVEIISSRAISKKITVSSSA